MEEVQCLGAGMFPGTIFPSQGAQLGHGWGFNPAAVGGAVRGLGSVRLYGGCGAGVGVRLRVSLCEGSHYLAMGAQPDMSHGGLPSYPFGFDLEAVNSFLGLE